MKEAYYGIKKLNISFVEQQLKNNTKKSHQCASQKRWQHIYRSKKINNNSQFDSITSSKLNKCLSQDKKCQRNNKSLNNNEETEIFSDNKFKGSYASNIYDRNNVIENKKNEDKTIEVEENIRSLSKLENKSDRKRRFSNNLPTKINLTKKSFVTEGSPTNRTLFQKKSQAFRILKCNQLSAQKIDHYIDNRKLFKTTSTTQKNIFNSFSITPKEITVRDGCKKMNEEASINKSVKGNKYENKRMKKQQKYNLFNTLQSWEVDKEWKYEDSQIC